MRQGAGAVTSPFFLGLVDSLGVRQVLPFDHLAYDGAVPAPCASGTARTP